MKTVKLENWAVCFLPQDAFGAAAAGGTIPGRLTGEVFGHPRFDDGNPITSTPITEAEGRLITTKSGTVYELGKAKEDYVEFTHNIPGKEDWDFDGDTPVVLRDKDEIDDEKQAEFDREEKRIKDQVLGEVRLAMMPTPETKH